MVRGERWAVALWLGLLLSGPVETLEAETTAAPTVRAVEVSGNRRIESATILAKVRSQVGAPLSAEAVRADIKALFQMGQFSDVSADTETRADGVALVFRVVERPFLTEFSFAGNKEIMTDKLKEQVTIKTPAVLDELQVKENAAQIRRYYEQEGFYNTEVIPVTKRQEDDRVSLIFYIREGSKARIREIGFSGNQKIREKQLHKTIESSTYNPWYSWLTGGGHYKKEELESDVDRIKDEYLNNGYVQVQVGTPTVRFFDRDRGVTVPVPLARGDLDFPYQYRDTNVSIAFPIVEGEQYDVRRIQFSGNTVFTEAELRAAMKLAEGELFRRNRLRESISAIHERYGEKGYIYADVIPQFDVVPGERKVDLVIQIKEDNQMTVRAITIAGNDKTRDKVLRRELRVDEREIADMKQLRRSFQRINNLNFFESIEIVPERVDSDEVDLHVRVKEKPTGSLSIGGGYSSVDGPVALASVTEGNLFGQGQLLRAQAELGRRRTTYSLTFREPYLLDYDVSGTFSVYNQVRDFDTYDERRVGGSVVLGKSFTEYLSGSVSYKRERLRLFNLDEEDAPRLVLEQAENNDGRSTTSSIGTTLAYDTRDFFFDPSSGGRYALTAELAGTVLGGTNDFMKVVGDASHFFPVFWGTVLSAHLRVGYAFGIQGDELPVGERFFIGGINTVRGFRFGRAGPVSDDDEIEGGNKELIVNLEYLIPLVPEAKVKGVIFFDLGRGFGEEEKLFELGLRRAAGFGLRWISPIGPLRLEWGRNLDPRAGERGAELEFTIGTLF